MMIYKGLAWSLLMMSWEKWFKRLILMEINMSALKNSEIFLMKVEIQEIMRLIYVVY